MDAIQAMLTRKSVKKYKDTPVPRALIEQVIEAGLHAPSGLNKQAAIILAVTNKEVRDELSLVNAGADPFHRADPFYGAPAVLIVLYDKSVRTGIYDASLVMGNLMLAAEALGLGSCWIHRAKEEFESEYGKSLLSSLGIVGEYEGVGHCIVGYADGEKPQAKPRKENWAYYIR